MSRNQEQSNESYIANKLYDIAYGLEMHAVKHMRKDPASLCTWKCAVYCNIADKLRGWGNKLWK